MYKWHLEKSKNKTVESGVAENNQQTQYTERQNEGIAQDMRKINCKRKYTLEVNV
jgi:hypothetical protein